MWWAVRDRVRVGCNARLQVVCEQCAGRIAFQTVVASVPGLTVEYLLLPSGALRYRRHHQRRLTVNFTESSCESEKYWTGTI